MSEIINEQTPIALGAVVSLIGGAVAALWWLIQGISSIRDDVRDVKTDVKLLRQETQSRVDGALSREDFMRFVAMNPGLKLPEEFT